MEQNCGNETNNVHDLTEAAARKEAARRAQELSDNRPDLKKAMAAILLNPEIANEEVPAHLAKLTRGRISSKTIIKRQEATVDKFRGSIKRKEE